MTEDAIKQWEPLAESCLTSVLKRYAYDESRRENGKGALREKIAKALKSDLSKPEKEKHLLPYYDSSNDLKKDRLAQRRSTYSRIGREL